jgi:hypothetical protein
LVEQFRVPTTETDVAPRLGTRDDCFVDLLQMQATLRSSCWRFHSQTKASGRTRQVLRRATPKDGAATKEADTKVLERGLLHMDATQNNVATPFDCENFKLIGGTNSRLTIYSPNASHPRISL